MVLLFILKGIGIVIIFILGFFIGLLPIKWLYFRSNLRLVGLSNSLSAGIFLSISLLHLLPEANEQFKENLSTNFPFAFLIAIISYTFVLIIEKLAFDSHSLLEIHVHPDLHHGEHQHNPVEKKVEIDTYLVSVNDKFNCCNDNKINCKDLMEKCDDFTKKTMNQEDHIDQLSPSPLSLNENKILNKVLLEDKAKSMTYSDHLNVEKDYDEGVFKDLLNTKAMLAKRISIHQKHKRQHEEIKKQLAHNSPSERKKLMTEKIQHNIGKFTPYILLIALSFHGIFEGIAIGIQNDLTGLTNLLIAVALHKWAEALTLGISFFKNQATSTTSIKMIAIFSSTGPIGIGIGWALTDSSELIEATFLSISAGTFLYIASSELVVEEFSISKNKWMKLLFFLFGVGLLVGLWFMEN